MWGIFNSNIDSFEFIFLFRLWFIDYLMVTFCWIISTYCHFNALIVSSIFFYGGLVVCSRFFRMLNASLEQFLSCVRNRRCNKNGKDISHEEAIFHIEQYGFLYKKTSILSTTFFQIFGFVSLVSSSELTLTSVSSTFARIIQNKNTIWPN